MTQQPINVPTIREGIARLVDTAAANPAIEPDVRIIIDGFITILNLTLTELEETQQREAQLRALLKRADEIMDESMALLRTLRDTRL